MIHPSPTKEKRVFIHEKVVLPYGDLVCETVPGKGRHYVTPQGKRYPSITTVLGIHHEEHVRNWKAAVGEEKAARVGRAACSRGEAVHDSVDKLIQNKEVNTSLLMPDARASFASIRPVIEKRVGVVFLQERPLYSDHLGLAGRVDLIAEFDGILSVIDIKTSIRIKKREDIITYFMQESGYSIMFEERTRIPITQLVTIMAVDFQKEPLVFVEHRDEWANPLIETVREYNRRLKTVST